MSNPNDELLLCFDVSKATLNLFSQYPSNGCIFRVEDKIANRTNAMQPPSVRTTAITFASITLVQSRRRFRGLNANDEVRAFNDLLLRLRAALPDQPV